MTDKEFKRLNRAQLIEIIYQLQLEIDKLSEHNKALEKALEDKRLKITNAGNLAEAALEINNCFQSAQNAADQYLNEIKLIYAEAEKEKERIIEDARRQAGQIRTESVVKPPQKPIIKREKSIVRDESDAILQSILEQYGLRRSGDR